MLSFLENPVSLLTICINIYRNPFHYNNSNILRYPDRILGTNKAYKNNITYFRNLKCDYI